MQSGVFTFPCSLARRFWLTAGLIAIVSGCYGSRPGSGHGGSGGAGGAGGGAAGTGGAGAAAGLAATAGTGGTNAAAGTAGTAGVGGSVGCDGGSCTCSPPNTICPDACTNLATDANNCTACGNICLPPPANGHAICQGSAGCGVQCDSGHLKCGNTCCDTPPATANAFATCSSSSACGIQCNSGNHACSGTSSPCYDDTDVTHCGPGCTDCRQPNATAVCTGAQCANICTGTTVACPGTAGHVVCGTWDFESGTTEGWTNNSASWSSDGSDGMFGVSTQRAFTGTHSLAITHDNPTGGFAVSSIKIRLCPTGVPVDLSSKSLWLNVYLEPSVGGDLDTSDSEFAYELSNGANGVGLLDLGSGMLPAGQWMTISASLAPLATSGATAITGIEIWLETSNKPWVGTIYFDNFRVE
jgi:hypothetical protein